MRGSSFFQLSCSDILLGQKADLKEGGCLNWAATYSLNPALEHCVTCSYKIINNVQWDQRSSCPRTQKTILLRAHGVSLLMVVLSQLAEYYTTVPCIAPIPWQTATAAVATTVTLLSVLNGLERPLTASSAQSVPSGLFQCWSAQLLFR